MTVRANKPAFNIREKLKELERPIGVKGSELMRAETAQDARDLVSAGRKNIVYNGNMEIAQRGTSFASLSSGTTRTLDGMAMSFSGGNGGTWTVSQESDAPPGFQKSIKALCTSGYTDTTNNYVSFAHRIEGYNLNHLAYGTSSAKPITISFWVKCSKPGPHLVFEIYTGRNFTRLININQANTWEYKTETVDGDTAAAFLSTVNTVGAYVNFFFGLGTDYKASAMNTSWSGYSEGARAYGLVNLNQTNDYIQITGVQLEVGKNATEFEHRSYGEELALCQRYYETGTNSCWSGTTATSVTYARVVVPFKVRKRATPTSVTATVFDYGGGFNASSTATTNSPSVDAFQWYSLANAGSNDSWIFCSWTANAEL